MNTNAAESRESGMDQDVAERVAELAEGLDLPVPGEVTELMGDSGEVTHEIEQL